MISVLCIDPKGYYPKLQSKYNLDLWDANRDAYNFKGGNVVIAHPPCQQWSRMKAFAKPNEYQKKLAFFCWDKVNENGGIFEHPVGSSFIKMVNPNFDNVYRVFQKDFGFPTNKATLLYFKNIKPLPVPLTFQPATKTHEQIAYVKRSIMTLSFCEWLINNCKQLNP